MFQVAQRCVTVVPDRLLFLQSTIQSLRTGFGFSFVHFRDLPTIRFASFKTTLCCFNAPNATPASACLSHHFAHFLTGMVRATVIAINEVFCFFSHGMPFKLHHNQ
jgi:hypothetical protein